MVNRLRLLVHWLLVVDGLRHVLLIKCDHFLDGGDGVVVHSVEGAVVGPFLGMGEGPGGLS
jgi:hypothetical protein